ncbi:MAG: hypothetical protein JXB88_21625 [Spirochaetales bacterium]|nr:hypothetical protein [Spirochaetales bacterium]
MIIQLHREFESIYGFPAVTSVDTQIFTIRYPETGCLDLGCRDICCSGGAVMDITTFNKLRKSGLYPLIHWDSFNFENDPYYPGGLGCYTPVENNRCVFQNTTGNGCGIHTYCLENGIPVHELKFFACCIFPCEVNSVAGYKNVLTAGYELRHPDYYFPCKDIGTTTIYQSARNDILHYFGPSLLYELDTMMNELLLQVEGSL